jgi:hypothetical protein
VFEGLMIFKALHQLKMKCCLLTEEGDIEAEAEVAKVEEVAHINQVQIQKVQKVARRNRVQAQKILSTNMVSKCDAMLVIR